MRLLDSHPPQEPALSNILVLTDHPDPRLLLLEYAVENGQASLSCTWHSSLFDRIARHAEFFTDIAVSESREVAVVSCYVGKLKVIHFLEGEVESDFEVMYVVPQYPRRSTHSSSRSQLTGTECPRTMHLTL